MIRKAVKGFFLYLALGISLVKAELKISQSQISFGDIAPETVVKERLEVKNNNDFPVIIERAVVGYGVTLEQISGESLVLPLEVPSRGKVDFKLAFDSSDIEGNYETLLRLFTNDSTNSFLALQVSLTVTPPLEVEPKILIIENGVSGFGPHRRGFSIIPKRPIVPNSIKVSTLNPSLKVVQIIGDSTGELLKEGDLTYEVTFLENNSNDSSQVFNRKEIRERVIIEYEVPLSEGKTSQKVKILPFYASLRPPLSIAKGRINLSEENPTVSLPVILGNDEVNKRFNSLKAESNTDSVESEIFRQNHDLTLRVRLVERIDKLFRGSIRLKGKDAEGKECQLSEDIGLILTPRKVKK
jgi:hypothetical protein